MQAPIANLDSIVPTKQIVKELSVSSGNKFADASKTNSILNECSVKWLYWQLIDKIWHALTQLDHLLLRL